MTGPPGEDLARYRWHTGAPLRPLAPEEPCPVLFRDLGTVALARFLRGELRRLAGPSTPLLYMRTVDFREPYTDYEHTGRLVFLRPRALAPWHSGVPHVFVARATRSAEEAAVGYVPGGVDLARLAREATAMSDARELREALGGASYDDACADGLRQLDALNADLEATERVARPLRKRFRSLDRDERSRAREAMERAGLTETDLCAAWHHLPRARRDVVRAALAMLADEGSQ
jgi:hypothetical protein